MCLADFKHLAFALSPKELQPKDDFTRKSATQLTEVPNCVKFSTYIFSMAMHVSVCPD